MPSRHCCSIFLALICALLIFAWSVPLASCAAQQENNAQHNAFDDTLRGLFDQYDEFGDYDETDLNEITEGASDDVLFRSKLTNMIKDKVKGWLRIPRDFPIDDDDGDSDSRRRSEYFYDPEDEDDADYMDALLYMQMMEQHDRDEIERDDMGNLNRGVFDYVMDDEWLERVPGGVMMAGEYSDEVFGGFDKTEML